MKLPFIFQKDKNPWEDGSHGAVAQGLTDLDLDDDVRGLSNLYSPDLEPDFQPAHQVRDIADVLVELGKLSADSCSYLREQQRQGAVIDVAQWLLEQELVNTDDLLMAKAHMYGYAFERIRPDDVDDAVIKLLEFDYIERCRLIPVRMDDLKVVVATSEPSNSFALEEIKRQLRQETKVLVCAGADIDTILESQRHQVNNLANNIDDIIDDMTEVEVVEDHDEECEDLEKMAGQSPVIKFVNYLISNAIRDGASDIHIEPKEKITRIRYRIDGVLFETKQAPIKMHPAIVSRIKIMANLDISERRLPQDGKVSVIVGGRAVDLRVSTLPTNHGEKTVIRVLDSQSIIRGLEELGMEPNVCETFAEQVQMPHGIFLVTGPTGSGKSTTLYSALRQMDGDHLNVSTVEDPVEYELDFCNQIQVVEKIGMTFSAALRSLLRQDPDVIMVGEIRDNETARIAVQAALTGHMVLSTLHTNDAASSITRLVNIGVDAYLVAASLNGALAQRLVRKICDHCKEPYAVPDNMRKYVERSKMQTDELFHGAGCDKCRGSGYQGRLGIYELMVIDDDMRDMINKDASVVNMRRAFLQSGQASLYDDGMFKVKRGLTTVEEVLRVTEVYGQTENEVFEENR